MKRRPAAPGSGVVPAVLQAPGRVEDWVSAKEIALHTFGPGCPGCPIVDSDCDFHIRRLAHRRRRDAQLAWLAKQDPGSRRGGYRLLPDGMPCWSDEPAVPAKGRRR